MKNVVLLFLLIGCGKTVVEKVNFPANNASAVETEEFEEALASLQSDFDQADIKVKLDAIPYSITDLDGAMGICYKKGNGATVGIALDHSLFEDRHEYEDSYDLLYKVLLHEIGHCFFNRDHDEEYFKIPGYYMLIKYYADQAPERRDSFQQSMMSELGWFQTPKLIWPYYVKEIARKARITSWEQITPFTEVTIVPKIEISLKNVKQSH
jgi:hypothetical protein